MQNTANISKRTTLIRFFDENNFFFSNNFLEKIKNKLTKIMIKVFKKFI